MHKPKRYSQSLRKIADGCHFETASKTIPHRHRGTTQDATASVQAGDFPVVTNAQTFSFAASLQFQFAL